MHSSFSIPCGRVPEFDYRVATVILNIRRCGSDAKISFLSLTISWDWRANGPTLSADAEARLLTYHWPGNVRELRSVIEQAVIFAMGIEIQADELTSRRTQAVSTQILGQWRMLRCAIFCR